MGGILEIKVAKKFFFVVVREGIVLVEEKNVVL